MFNNKSNFDHLYHLALNDTDKKALFIKILAISISFLLLVVFNGFNRFYGMIFNRMLMFVYILQIVDLCSIYSGVYTLFFYNKYLTDRDINKSLNKFPTYTNLLMILNSISIILGIVYVVKEGFHNDVMEFIFFLIINILMIVLSFYFKKTIDNVYVEKNKEEEWLC